VEKGSEGMGRGRKMKRKALQLQMTLSTAARSPTPRNVLKFTAYLPSSHPLHILFLGMKYSSLRALLSFAQVHLSQQAQHWKLKSQPPPPAHSISLVPAIFFNSTNPLKCHIILFTYLCLLCLPTPALVQIDAPWGHRFLSEFSLLYP
jgi:hypothetical protein